MGLSIHYQWKANLSDDAARSAVQSLCDLARALDFEVDGVDDHDLGKPGNRGAQMWLTHYEILGKDSEGPYVSFEPGRAIMFLAQAEGCEPIFMGLAKYPTSVKFRGKTIKARLGRGWFWTAHVKTQYCALPQHGGVKNFLNTHIGIVRLCDRAKELGFDVEISDEGDYWQKRDEKILLDKMKFLERAMAGLSGALKDGGLSVESAIAAHPEFERLEARGRDELADKITDVMEEVKGALKAMDAKPKDKSPAKRKRRAK